MHDTWQQDFTTNHPHHPPATAPPVRSKVGRRAARDIEGLNGDVNAVQSGAAADGAPAPDKAPSDSQLASDDS
jgi:hypothetical protein